MNISIKFLIKLISIFILSSKLNAAVISEIIIKGNNRVSSETIKVYGDIKENDNVDAGKINEILKNLYSTNFFENVEVREENGLLEIVVEEYPVVNQLIIEGEPSNRIREKIEELISTKTKQSFLVKNYYNI